MTELNIHGQTKLMVLKLKSRQNYLHSLSGKALQEADKLKKLREELKEELENCELAESYYQKARHESASLKSQVRGIKASIDTYRRHPEVNRIISDKKKPTTISFKFPRHRTTELATPIAGAAGIALGRPPYSKTPHTPTPTPPGSDLATPKPDSHVHRQSSIFHTAYDLDGSSSEEENEEESQTTKKRNERPKLKGKSLDGADPESERKTELPETDGTGDNIIPEDAS